MNNCPTELDHRINGEWADRLGWDKGRKGISDKALKTEEEEEEKKGLGWMFVVKMFDCYDI